MGITKKELICVNCPMGCRLQVTMEELWQAEAPEGAQPKANGDRSAQEPASVHIEVSGNRCPRGKAYAEKECIRPERILTTTVRITGGKHRVLPVITDREIPLDLMLQAMETVRSLVVAAPVREGDVIAENLLGTGAKLIASRSMGSLENDVR